MLILFHSIHQNAINLFLQPSHLIMNRHISQIRLALLYFELDDWDNDPHIIRVAFGALVLCDLQISVRGVISAHFESSLGCLDMQHHLNI